MAQTRKRKATAAATANDDGDGASCGAEGDARGSSFPDAEDPAPPETANGVNEVRLDADSIPESSSRAAGRRRVMEEVARRRAAHFARFDSDQAAAPIPDVNATVQSEGRDVSGSERKEDSVKEAWCGPFATARQLVEGRDAALAERQATATSASLEGAATICWTPKPRPSAPVGVGGGLDSPPVKPLFQVPSLLDMCVELLCKYLDAVESLEGLPEVALQRLTRAMCEKRLLTSHVLKLLCGPTTSELVWPDCTLLGEVELTAALSQCVGGRLQRLDLGFCGRGLSDKGIASTLGSTPGCLPHLRQLSLRGAYRVTDQGLAAALSGAPNVTSLGITDNVHVTGKGLEAIARMPSGVGVDATPSATPLGFDSTSSAIRQHLNKLDSSGASSCHAEADPIPSTISTTSTSGANPCHAGAACSSGLAALIPVDPQPRRISIGQRLTELTLDGCAGLRPACVALALAAMPNLARLSMRGALACVTDGFLQEVAASLGRRLEYLDVADCSAVTDVGIRAVAVCCPSLAHLDVGGLDRITGASLAALGSGCRVLQSVVLRRCRGIPNLDLHEFVRNRGANLRHLSLNSLPKVSDEVLLALATSCADSLESLDASWCRQLSDRALGLLADSCPRLGELKLWGCTQITELFLKGHSNSKLVVVGLS